jgi:flagellar export protein FliJ
MTRFRFPLQKVLDWRRAQLELEEFRFKQNTAALADLDRASAALAASEIGTEAEVRGWKPVTGGDLAALGSFRAGVKKSEAEIARRRAECRQKLDAQQAAMLEARRRCRLLERLKQRRETEWEALRDREIQEMAEEAFLAKWSRELRRI